MTEIPSESSIKNRIFSEFAIYGASYVFGPLAGGYMIRKNFIEFGETERAEKTRKITLLICIAVFILTAFIPGYIMSKLPNITE